MFKIKKNRNIMYGENEEKNGNLISIKQNGYDM